MTQSPSDGPLPVIGRQLDSPPVGEPKLSPAVRLATVTEGQCVELLHEGPFSEEHLSLKIMDEFMAEHALVANGLHHEIYLTALDDPAPRTLLRQPVRPA